MNESVEFGVRVTTSDRGAVDIDIWHFIPGTKKPADFAKISAGNLDTAVQMAVPYIIASAQPNPFARLLAGDVQSTKPTAAESDSGE